MFSLASTNFRRTHESNKYNYDLSLGSMKPKDDNGHHAGVRTHDV